MMLVFIFQLRCSFSICFNNSEKPDYPLLAYFCSLSMEETYLGSSSASILGQTISFGLPNFRYSNDFHRRRGSGFVVRAEVVSMI